MKTYNTILFDWDGCLAKTLDIWLSAYKTVFAEYGLKPDIHTITHTVFGDWNGPKKLGITDIDTYTDKLMSIVNAQYPFAELYPHAKYIIQELHTQGHKLALLTSSKKPTIIPALERTHLAQYFDVVLTGDDVTKHKPDPEVILVALKKLDTKNEEAIIIGDSKSDLGAAVNAGIDSMLYYPKHNEVFYDISTLSSYNPTYIIDDLKKVIDIVQ